MIPADRLFVPAAFVGLLADMPAVSASLEAWDAWLTITERRLYQAIESEHGLSAFALLKALHEVRRDRDDMVAEVLYDLASDRRAVAA
ncbi:hypothetical protein ACFWY9_16565 [Amycolatopsis sp. NPDC059027]|uniref:hypothetical protein n=1 Tax=Amycolatopsis sp. NPDC059027 TaxID=3346709 RepID=UPI00366B0F14